ncbi:magnesium transporter [Alkalibacter saccharofermentans]|uniref:Magnesium transporter MgtE n=1 Tax=Alkalibacter saccharofermentans DSM 14828 TaxID=1120975 RepID=A0A1M4VKY1_9FIRM|nr:magnesium transporter [Alkalibacter saccharofermentans]SHE69691.1 magnesium transporter [Alkalibacter saccharofermentans DSM 14828]
MYEKLFDLINQGKFTAARNEIVEMNVVDIAQFLEEIPVEKLLVIFRLLPKEIVADVFSYMPIEDKQHIIEAITDKEIRHIIDELFLDDTVDMVEEMPANVVKKVLKNTTKEERDLINRFLKYPEYSAGSMMTIEYVDLKEDMSVAEALEHIKRTGVDKETINTCYVIDKGRKLQGIVSLRRLILSDSSKRIKDIMNTKIISIPTHLDQEDTAMLFKKYDLTAMPVVDTESRLVGIITIDDVVDIIEQENTEDFHKMAAMEPSDEEYLKSGIFNLAKKRIAWLLVLMISATFTGAIIRNYEDILQSVVILAAFIPRLMDTGGNAGSQSATLVIRGLALDEIKLKDTLKVLSKEFKVSLVVGVALASVNFIMIYFFERTDIRIAFTVCISLFLTVVLAKVVGGTLPIMAKKMNLDPAIMAGPLITTIVDAVALMAFFSLSSWILGI